MDNKEKIKCFWCGFLKQGLKAKITILAGDRFDKNKEAQLPLKYCPACGICLGEKHLYGK